MVLSVETQELYRKVLSDEMTMIMLIIMMMMFTMMIMIMLIMINNDGDDVLKVISCCDQNDEATYNTCLR